jgi:hypothetical protein
MASTNWWEQFTRLFQSSDQREQERRMAVREQNRARSSEEEIDQRETRRLAGMSAEDRAWEQASLARNRDAQDRSPS